MNAHDVPLGPDASDTAAPGEAILFAGHRVHALQWVVLAACFLVVLLDGFDTAAIGYVAPSLLKDWGLARPQLGAVLSAALFGLAAGAALAGPLADRFGRKRVLAAAVAAFGLASLACAQAPGLQAMVMLRFLTGIGLGAAMPNAVTLFSEYAPQQRRALLTNAMFCGFPLGAGFGGFLTAWMIPQWGWRSVLWLGGCAPLVLAGAILLAVPESLRYLVAVGADPARIRAILARLGGSDMPGAFAPAGMPALRAGSQQPQVGRAARPALWPALAQILSRRHLAGTLALWTAYFMGLVVFYATVNWMPLLLKDSGLDPRQATLVTALFPLGGIGAVFSGVLMDRGNADRVVACAYLLTGLFMFLLARADSHLGWTVVAVAAAGLAMNTAQASMGSLAAAFYPTLGRATGVAWMMGVGRFGGIAGTLLVAYASSQAMSPRDTFALLALPGFVAGAALLLKGR